VLTAAGLQGIDGRAIRRGVETLLQSLGVPRDVRAHLLSHGTGGVQGGSYERHGYDEEMRHALKELHRALLGAW
jgi:hypothetical protein